MTLPKKGTRTLELNGIEYRWMVGKLRVQRDGSAIAPICVEFPDGKIRTTTVKVKDREGTHRSVTTGDVISFIEDLQSL